MFSRPSRFYLGEVFLGPIDGPQRFGEGGEGEKNLSPPEIEPEFLGRQTNA
jgi:hypothetical protein